MNKDLRNKKHQALLVTARNLFWKHGFRRVTIEEICREAGVSKMTFYRHFDNKKALAMAVYDEVIANSTNTLRGIFKDENTSTAEKIQKLLSIKMEGTNDISREFLQDFYNNPELGLTSYIEIRTRESWQEVISIFKQAQEKGNFRKDFKPEFLLVLGQKLQELMNNETLLSMYDSPQALIMEMTSIMVYGIAPRD
jgi:AcrR family transcriptional regulator